MKPLSQDQGFHERWTDEHKSLPLFSLLLFKVDCVLVLESEDSTADTELFRPNPVEFVKPRDIST